MCRRMVDGKERVNDSGTYKDGVRCTLVCIYRIPNGKKEQTMSEYRLFKVIRTDGQKERSE